MQRRAAAAMAAWALLFACALMPAAAAADPPLAQQFAAAIPTASSDLNVTVILAGISLTPDERAALLHAVTPFWWPFVSAAKVPLGVNYSVNVELVDAPQAFLDDYAQFLAASFANDTISRALGNYVGVFDNVSAAFPSWSEATPVRHADAAAAANWLEDSSGPYPALAPSPGAARLFFLNAEALTEPYYYAISSLERDRNTPLVYETANAWGDGGGVYFEDLRALPSHLGEFSASGRPANFAGFAPYWSYGSTAQERERLVLDLAHYVDTMVQQLIAPSFGVAPYFAASLTLEVTVFDATDAGTVFKQGGVGASVGIETLGDVLDADQVGASLRDLIPYTTVNSHITTANATSDPELASALAAAASVVDGATVIDPFVLEARLRERWDVPGLPIEPGESVKVPALLVIEDATAWVDTTDIRGVTLQRSDGRAAGIVIAAGLDQLHERAFSETVVHESGHALGFAHPHEISFVGGNGSVVTVVDWLHSLSSTPMTYLPSYVDYTFDGFDRHALWEGVAAITLGEAYQLRQAAYARFDQLGYNRSTLPASVASHEALFQSFANTTRDLLGNGVLYIEAEPPYSAGGAIMMAKHAYDEAKEITTRAALSPRCCTPRASGFLPGLDAAPALVALAVVAAAAVVVGARRR